MPGNYAFEKNTYEFPSCFREYVSGCSKRRKIGNGF